MAETIDRIEIAKLDLQPGDALAVIVPEGVLPNPVLEEALQEISQALSVKVLIVERGFEFSVIRKEDLDA